MKENKNYFEKLITDLRGKMSNEKTGTSDSRCLDESAAKSNAFVSEPDQVGPSTSNNIPSVFSHYDATNEIDIEEMKIEPCDDNFISCGVDLGKKSDSDECDDSEELFPSTRKRSKRVRNLNFEESESSDEIVKNEIPFFPVKMKDDSYDSVFDGKKYSIILFWRIDLCF